MVEVGKEEVLEEVEVVEDLAETEVETEIDQIEIVVVQDQVVHTSQLQDISKQEM
jgi:hypothetical protein